MSFQNTSKKFIHKNFHALTHKNFRKYWLGQCVSLMGTWVQNIGQSWLVFSLTKSPLLLGLLGTVQFLPITIFSLFAGVLIDKFPKKKILLLTQSISMVLALILATLIFTHHVRYEYILVLAFILGCVNAFDMPTRQSFTIEIAGKEDLMNAIALNSATFNLARIVGPAIGGLFLAYLGAGWCFLLNGLSFMAVLYSLLHIEGQTYLRKKATDSNILKEIGAGIRYIIKNPILSQTLLMVTVVGIFVFNYGVLIPVFTKNVLHQSEKAYGMLMSALGVGSLLGALLVSMKSKRGPQKKVMIGSAIMISIMLFLMKFIGNYYMALLFLVIVGVFNIAFSTTANSTLQINAKDEYRGRVMSVYSLVFAGATPLGNLFTGYTAEKFGAATSFMLCGILTLFFIAVITILYRKASSKK